MSCIFSCGTYIQSIYIIHLHTIPQKKKETDFTYLNSSRAKNPIQFSLCPNEKEEKKNIKKQQQCVFSMPGIQSERYELCVQTHG